VLPTHGAVGLLSRLAVTAALPVALLAMGFLHPGEVRRLRGGVAMVRRRPA
jgi:hypothetical protein